MIVSLISLRMFFLCRNWDKIELMASIYVVQFLKGFLNKYIGVLGNFV